MVKTVRRDRRAPMDRLGEDKGKKGEAKKNEERGDTAVRAIDVYKALIDDLEKKDKATIEAALKEMKKYLTPLDLEEVRDAITERMPFLKNADVRLSEDKDAVRITILSDGIGRMGLRKLQDIVQDYNPQYTIHAVYPVLHESKFIIEFTLSA